MRIKPSKLFIAYMYIILAIPQLVEESEHTRAHFIGVRRRWHKLKMVEDKTL